MGLLRILNHNGDSEMPWTPGDAASMRAVQDEVDRLVGKGALLFKGDGVGRDAEPIDKFDPSADEILVLPRVVGG